MQRTDAILLENLRVASLFPGRRGPKPVGQRMPEFSPAGDIDSALQIIGRLLALHFAERLDQ